MKFVDFLAKRTILGNGLLNQEPRVSIVMPTYCRHAEGLLIPCIESVLRQSFKNFEFIIVDDGSSDGSEATIRRYAERDPRILYVRHGDNSGLPAVRTNEGILLSRAPYIAFIFDDNTWEQDALECLIGAMEGGYADLVYGNAILAEKGENRFGGNLPLSVELMQNFNYIINGAVLCRREFFNQYGLYDPHLLMRRICDWDLWLRALKRGANFQHLDQIICTEHGLDSKSSLGNTVNWDYKTSLAYIQDETQLDKRIASLRPGDIMDFDILNPEQGLHYLRDWKEWDRIEENIYRPYLDAHRQVSFEPLIRDNRRHDQELYGYALNTAHPIFHDRKRILLVANRYERTVQDWWRALSYDINHIVVTCNELGLSGFSPAELNWVILFDCTLKTVVPFLKRCAEIGVPVTYVVVNGMDQPFTESNDPLKNLNLIRNENLRNYFGIDIYFSNPGTPWPARDQQDVDQIMEYTDQVFMIGDIDSQEPEKTKKFSPIKFVANAIEEQSVKSIHMELALYLGEAMYLTEAAKVALNGWLERSPIDRKWKVYCYPGKLPSNLKVLSQGAQVLPTYDSLPTLAQKLNHTFLAVPGEILDRLGDYHRSILEEDLGRNGCCLDAIHLGTKLPAEISLEFFHQKVKALHTHLAERAIGHRQDARWIHLQNIVRGVAIRKRLADFRHQPCARQVKTLVFVNSQLFGGSEVYGFLIFKALSEIGFDIQACIPKYDEYSSGSEKMVEWLRNQRLPPVLQLEYGRATRSLYSKNFFEGQESSENLRTWLDQHDVGIVFCSGFISEPLAAPSEGRLVFMGLYPPWGHSLSGMTFIRERLDGLFSDSVWAAEKWAEWVGPPVAYVPCMISPQFFLVCNTTLPPSPICIAVVGTMLNLKRQREVILATSKLIEEGFDLRLNFYGYELPMYSAYVQELKRIASQPSLKGRVFFHGYVETPGEIVRDNHLIVSASTEESLPQSLILNQAAGLVPVACPAGGIEEFVQDGITGFLATGFSIDALADALRRALKQRGDWPRLTTHGRRLLLQRCSPQIFTRSILAIMQDGIDIRLADGRKLFRESPSERLDRHPVLIRESKKSYRVARDEIISTSGVGINFPLVIGPDLCGSETRYRMKGTSDHLSGFYFQVGIFMTQPHGKLNLTVSSADSGCVLRRVVIDASSLVDNAWLKVNFDPIINAKDREFEVEVIARLNSGRVAIYEVSPLNKTVKYWMLPFQRRLRRFLRLPFERPAGAILPIYENNQKIREE